MDMHDWKAVQEQAEELHKHDVDQYNVLSKAKIPPPHIKKVCFRKFVLLI